MKYVRREVSPDDLRRQEELMDQVAELNAARNAPALALVDTYGCQQNEADSEKIRGMLIKMGYTMTDSEAEADIIVINTCAVREHAEQRVLGNVGALTHTKKAKPSQIICLCGCMMQEPGMAERIRASYPHVRLVFGPHVLWRFPEYLLALLRGRKRIYATDESDGVIAEGLPSARDSLVKAWLPIMYGCNNFCSYCIVPYVRGRERSRTPEDVLREARELVELGYKDITLLGQNVNSYGKDLDGGVDFSDLIEMINAIPGEFLIRFMTSHPKDAGEKLFSTMARCEKCARHIHLPFQSGSDRVLEAMNRRYTREGYLELVGMARRYMPDVVLTSDVIVGFPGETEAEFEETLSLIEEVRFDALFTFIFSPRVGTPAAGMPDPFTREEKQRRFDRLVEAQNAISEEKHREYVGKTARVLVDGREGELLTSRTSGGRLVRFPGDPALIGSFRDVRITGSSTWALNGELTGPEA